MDCSDWGCLPAHLLDGVVKKLVTCVGFIHFTAVCRGWLQAGKNEMHRLWSLPQVPLMLIPSGGDGDGDEDCARTLYDVCSESICSSIRWKVPVPTRYCGSSCGCLIFLQRVLQMVIWNPVRDSPPIVLPSLREFDEEWAQEFEFQFGKVILSADPYGDPRNCVAAALDVGNHTVYFIRLGDRSWTPLRGQDGTDDIRGGFLDVMYHHNVFYCLNVEDKIARVRVDALSFTVLNDMRLYTESFRWTRHQYLAMTSTGNLLLVRKNADRIQGCAQQRRTVDISLFNIHKSGESKAHDDDDEEEEYRTVNATSLRGDSIFVGTHDTTIVRAHDFLGCQPDSIYFIDDDMEPSLNELRPVHNGLLQLQTPSFSSNYQWNSSHKYMPAAIWIRPTPQFPSNV